MIQPFVPGIQPCARSPFFSMRLSAALGMVVTLWLLAACSSLPEIKPAGLDVQPNLRERCRSVFPAGPHQYIHSIEARLPDDSRTTVLGIVTLDPDSGVLHCVIMTIEGFVLFDARHGRTLMVNRAVPPFDSEGFAKNMMADVRLVFLPPGGAPVAAGLFGNGFPGCRWVDADGLAVDVLLNQERGWAIRQYDASDNLSGQVRAYALTSAGIPEKIELSRYRFPRYTLKMTLLQSQRLQQNDDRLH